MYKFEKDNYIGKQVRLYPNATYRKSAIIENVDDLGFTFRIIEANSQSRYKKGDVLFINHSNNLIMIFE